MAGASQSELQVERRIRSTPSRVCSYDDPESHRCGLPVPAVRCDRRWGRSCARSAPHFVAHPWVAGRSLVPQPAELARARAAHAPCDPGGVRCLVALCLRLCAFVRTGSSPVGVCCWGLGEVVRDVAPKSMLHMCVTLGPAAVMAFAGPHQAPVDDVRPSHLVLTGTKARPTSARTLAVIVIGQQRAPFGFATRVWDAVDATPCTRHCFNGTGHWLVHSHNTV